MPLRSPRCTAARASVDPVAADAEQADQVRVGAEAAVPDADAELGAEPRRHQRVVHPVDRERGHGEACRVARLGRRPEHAHAVDGPQALVAAGATARPRAPRWSSQPMRSSSSMAVAEGHRADDVGRAGLLALGRIGPDDLVQVDQVDRAAAGQEGVAVLEGRAAARSARRHRTARRACAR